MGFLFLFTIFLSFDTNTDVNYTPGSGVHLYVCGVAGGQPGTEAVGCRQHVPGKICIEQVHTLCSLTMIVLLVDEGAATLCLCFCSFHILICNQDQCFGGSQKLVEGIMKHSDRTK